MKLELKRLFALTIGTAIWLFVLWVVMTVVIGGGRLRAAEGDHWHIVRANLDFTLSTAEWKQVEINQQERETGRKEEFTADFEAKTGTRNGKNVDGEFDMKESVKTSQEILDGFISICPNIERVTSVLLKPYEEKTGDEINVIMKGETAGLAIYEFPTSLKCPDGEVIKTNEERAATYGLFAQSFLGWCAGIAEETRQPVNRAGER